MNNATLTLSRQFSRQGLVFMKVAQEAENVTVKQSDSGLLFKSAILMSFMGVGFSMFSVSQLQESNARGLGKICVPKS